MSQPHSSSVLTAIRPNLTQGVFSSLAVHRTRTPPKNKQNPTNWQRKPDFLQRDIINQAKQLKLVTKTESSQRESRICTSITKSPHNLNNKSLKNTSNNSLKKSGSHTLILQHMNNNNSYLNSKKNKDSGRLVRSSSSNSYSSKTNNQQLAQNYATFNHNTEDHGNNNNNNNNYNSIYSTVTANNNNIHKGNKKSAQASFKKNNQYENENNYLQKQQQEVHSINKRESDLIENILSSDETTSELNSNMNVQNNKYKLQNTHLKEAVQSLASQLSELGHKQKDYEDERNELNYILDSLKVQNEKLQNELDLQLQSNVMKQDSIDILQQEKQSLQQNLSQNRHIYQTELLKFSQQIQQFRHIQSLYSKEKLTSETFEKQLICKDEQLSDANKNIKLLLQLLIHIQNTFRDNTQQHLQDNFSFDCNNNDLLLPKSTKTQILAKIDNTLKQLLPIIQELQIQYNTNYYQQQSSQQQQPQQSSQISGKCYNMPLQSKNNDFNRDLVKSLDLQKTYKQQQAQKQQQQQQSYEQELIDNNNRKSLNSMSNNSNLSNNSNNSNGSNQTKINLNKEKTKEVGGNTSGKYFKNNAFQQMMQRQILGGISSFSNKQQAQTSNSSLGLSKSLCQSSQDIKELQIQKQIDELNIKNQQQQQQKQQQVFNETFKKLDDDEEGEGEDEECDIENNSNLIQQQQQQNDNYHIHNNKSLNNQNGNNVIKNNSSFQQFSTFKRSLDEHIQEEGSHQTAFNSQQLDLSNAITGIKKHGESTNTIHNPQLSVTQFDFDLNETGNNIQNINNKNDKQPLLQQIEEDCHVKANYSNGEYSTSEIENEHRCQSLQTKIMKASTNSIPKQTQNENKNGKQKVETTVQVIQSTKPPLDSKDKENKCPNQNKNAKKNGIDNFGNNASFNASSIRQSSEFSKEDQAGIHNSNSYSHNTNSNPNNNSNTNNKSKDQQYFICKLDYQAQKEGELNLVAGEKIQVMKQTKNGWWIGMKSNNDIGYFPFNFVEEE